MPFGQEFFRHLYRYQLLLAAPLREDTPRSALDAMAAGIPYLAYDTYYYNQLLESGAGVVVPWRDEQAMADELIRRLPESARRSAALTSLTVTEAPGCAATYRPPVAR